MCRRSSWPPPAPMHCSPSPASRSDMARSTRRQRRSSSRTGTACWRSMTSRRNTGSTCVRRTRSNRRSPPCGIGRRDHAIACRAAGGHPVQRWNSGAGQSAGTTETRRLIANASGSAYTRFDNSSRAKEGTHMRLVHSLRAGLRRLEGAVFAFYRMRKFMNIPGNKHEAEAS